MYKLKNRYFKSSKLSSGKTREIVKYFAMDFEITKISKLTYLDRKTINRNIQKIRRKIVKYCEELSRFQGEIECDESYFGGKKKGDKRRREVTNKVPVFGILKRDGKVYTRMIKTLRVRN